MATTMKKSERDLFVKEKAMEMLGLTHTAADDGNGNDFDYEHNIGEYGTYKFSIPVEAQDGQIYFVKVSLTAANDKATSKSPAFNPWDLRAEWDADREVKSAAKEERDRKREEKKARDIAAKAKKKAEKEITTAEVEE